jgi:citrate synthase
VYRGYKIEDLAKHGSFEEVTYLLWHGKLPTKSHLASFTKQLRKHMVLSGVVKKFIQSLPKHVTPMTGLRACISLLAIYDKDSDDISLQANKRKALRIMGATPSIIAGLVRRRQGKSLLGPKNTLSLGGNFLYMMQGKAPSKEAARTMDVCLLLHAEHGLNASTFAARVTVATLSDMHSGIASAIGTLKGPLHGGANKRAIQALHYLGDKLQVKDVCDISCLGDVDKYVYSLLKQHKRIMGIGHRVYKVKDPRAKILEQYAQQVVKSKKYYQMAKEIEKIMAKEKGLYPNVDFFSGIVYEHLNVHPDFYVCIFALARTAGWIAHILEQYSDNRLLRPRALYTGSLKKQYVRLEKRK